jgi:hypothetical protein
VVIALNLGDAPAHVTQLEGGQLLIEAHHRRDPSNALPVSNGTVAAHAAVIALLA